MFRQQKTKTDFLWSSSPQTLWHVTAMSHCPGSITALSYRKMSKSLQWRRFLGNFIALHLTICNITGSRVSWTLFTLVFKGKTSWFPTNWPTAQEKAKFNKANVYYSKRTSWLCMKPPPIYYKYNICRSGVVNVTERVLTYSFFTPAAMFLRRCSFFF